MEFFDRCLSGAMIECRKIPFWERSIFPSSRSISLKKTLTGTRWVLCTSDIDVADLKKTKTCFTFRCGCSKLKLTNNSFIFFIIIDYAESGQGLCFKCLILMPCTVTNHIHPHEIIMKHISSNSTYLIFPIFITALVWYLDSQNSYL